MRDRSGVVDPARRPTAVTARRRGPRQPHYFGGPTVWKLNVADALPLVATMVTVNLNHALGVNLNLCFRATPREDKMRDRSGSSIRRGGRLL
jgi:hypothetical protein